MHEPFLSGNEFASCSRHESDLRTGATILSRGAGNASRETVPWWVEGGSETCPHCLQSYVYELEVRCHRCDRPLCPQCVVTERLTVVNHLCPECTEEAGAEEGGV